MTLSGEHRAMSDSFHERNLRLLKKHHPKAYSAVVSGEVGSADGVGASRTDKNILFQDDSDPEKEYEETLDKGKALIEAIRHEGSVSKHAVRSAR